MLMSICVFVFSAAMSLFYLQIACQKILRRRSASSLAGRVINAYRLEFATLLEKLDEAGIREHHARVRGALSGDYLSLTYLLKHAANTKLRHSAEERLLMAYYRTLSLGLKFRHACGLDEKPAFQSMASILNHFCNVVADRISLVQSGNLAAADYILGL
jgi:hypothetical protein